MTKTQKNNKLRVLQVSQYLDAGGLETMLIDLSCQLHKSGVDVDVLCLKKINDQYIKKLREHNIPIHCIPEKSRLNLNFYKQFVRFICHNRFDIVHAHSGCQLNAALATRIAGGKKFIYTAHGMLMFTRLWDRIEDSLAGFLTDHLVSVSDEITIAMKKWFWFPRCQFETIVNGIDTDRFKPIADQESKDTLLKKYCLPTDRILFGSVGRLASVKNYAMALQAVKRLVDAGLTNICFVLVGEGAIGEGGQERYLRDLVNKLEIFDQVCFLGMQYNIHEILPLFRFFVLSSLTEGTSISLLESQACGIPAVVTDVGGNSSVISHAENGFLCPSNDDRKMSVYMQTLIKDSGLAEKMGGRARRRVERDFSVQTMTEKYLQIYRQESVKA